MDTPPHSHTPVSARHLRVGDHVVLDKCSGLVTRLCPGRDDLMIEVWDRRLGIHVCHVLPAGATLHRAAPGPRP